MKSNQCSPWITRGAFMVPVIATVIGLSLTTYNKRVKEIKARLEAPAAIKLVEANYHQDDYPDFTPLKSTLISVESQQDKQPVNSQIIAPSADVLAAEKQPISVATDDQQAEEQKKDDQDAEDALKNLDLSQLSASMQSKVQAALKSEKEDETQASEDEDAMDLRRHALEYKGVLPPLDFQTHVFTTDVPRRWVKINGVEYHQGDKILVDATLVEIKPKSTIIRFRGDLIEIPALYDWKG